MSEAPKKSYGQILKSSALIGGSTAISVGFSMVRAKAMALLLGPSGYGLFAIYNSISDLARTIAGLGIKSSGVRQIAEAVGSGDNRKVACTVTTLRRVALYSGAVGALLLVLLCKPVSKFSFETYEEAGAVALMASVAFFMDVSEGQTALIQGMRRIGDLARMNVLGALFGTISTIAIIYYFGKRGLVPSLVCVAVMTLITSWWYARKIKVEHVPVSTSEVLQEASGLVKLGLVFMVSALAAVGAAYFVRIILSRELGHAAAGYYQAAWAVGAVYISFILQAMGADFYPRLTAVANRHEECNQLVNEQAEVGLLMAGPGILGTLSFAPLAITIFYRPDFAPAAEVLRWLCLGMLVRVVTWPMGFIVLAKGDRKTFFWVEVLTNAGYVSLVWLGIKWLGLRGAGVAFFLLYSVNFVALYLVVRRLTGFRWSKASRHLAFLFAPLVLVVFLGCYFLSDWGAALLGAAVTLPAGFYSMKALCRLVPENNLPKPARKLIGLLGLRGST
ncbi:MAG TPA: O-antigen translocase [Candidatus Dormibacteraeota bacterium]|nr:O-antigen translocase [Candidatus Dormibacteraeota bacterium]